MSTQVCNTFQFKVVDGCCVFSDTFFGELQVVPISTSLKFTNK